MSIFLKKYKIEETYDGWTSRNIPELLNRAYNEFLRDNWEQLLLKEV